MTVPWKCGSCSVINMIDLLALESKPVDKIVSARGFCCKKCGEWQAVSYTSTSLREAESKLARYTPRHEQFMFLFKRLLHKASHMAEKMTTP